MLTGIYQRAQGLNPLLTKHFLFVTAELNDFAKIDNIVLLNHTNIDVMLEKAQHEGKDNVVNVLTAYKLAADLVDALRNDLHTKQEILLGAGAKPLNSLIIAVARADNVTALKLIARDVFTPDVAVKEPGLLRQLKANPVLWQGLIKHRSDQLKSQWLLLEMSLQDAARNMQKSSETDFISGMQIMGSLPVELQLDVLNYARPSWLPESKGHKILYHMHSYIAQKLDKADITRNADDVLLEEKFKKLSLQ